MKFAKKVDLTSLKSEVVGLDIDKLEKVPTGKNSLKSKVDKLDVDKWVPVPINLNQLRNVVKQDFVKKTEYDELVKKVNAIQTTDASDLAIKADYNTKVNKIKKNITDHDHDKYITTQEFNKLTSEKFAARLVQAKLGSKNNIATFSKKTDFDDELKKHEEKCYFK